MGAVWEGQGVSRLGWEQCGKDRVGVKRGGSRECS